MIKETSNEFTVAPTRNQTVSRWSLLFILQAMNVWRAYPLYIKYNTIGWGELNLFDTGALLLGVAGIAILVIVPLVLLYQR